MVRPDAEIYLLDLLAGFFRALKRNRLLSIMLPTAGLVAGLVMAYLAPVTYNSKLIVQTSLLSENECRFLVGALNRAKPLPGLSADESQAVNNFEVIVVKDPVQPEAKDELKLIEKNLYMEITAHSSQPDVFLKLGESVVTFINSSPLVVRARDRRNRFYNEMIGRIEQEIGGMDEIKQQINSKSQQSLVDPSALYSRTVDLYREKTQYEMRREQIKTVHLIQGFTAVAKNSNPTPVIAGAAGLVAGFLALCAVLFLRFFVGYYKTSGHSEISR